MTEKKKAPGSLSRREFLKAGAAGACAFCLAGAFGCAPPEQPDEPAPTEPVDPNNETVPPPVTAEKGFVSPVLAGWFSELEESRVRCELCPRQCQMAEGERGPCRVRKNREGKLYTLAYGNPALVQEDPVERKPFFHVLPGSRALSISTAGCNLDCKFCEVWDMALVAPEEVYAYDMPPEKVVAHARDSGVRAISYAFGEPVIFHEYMTEVAALAKEAGLLNLLHTAGYIRPEPLRELSGHLDAVNVDLKSFDEEFYREVVGGELGPVLETLQRLGEAGVHIEVTNIVIPTLNDDMETIGEMCRWIAGELGAGIPVHFARFYPLYKLSGLPRTPVSTLDQARDTALQAGLRYAYVARVPGHEGENTFCPGCKELVINRMGFVIEEVHLKDSACRYCGTVIPGRWD